jgi:hypothetical protein
MRSYNFESWWMNEYGVPVEWYWQGTNKRVRRKPLPIVTLPTTSPTWTSLSMNTGLRGEKPATNCLSHGTALNNSYFLHILTVALQSKQEEVPMHYSAVTRISKGTWAPYQVLCLSFLIYFIRFLNINSWDNNIRALIHLWQCTISG